MRKIEVSSNDACFNIEISLLEEIETIQQIIYILRCRLKWLDSAIRDSKSLEECENDLQAKQLYRETLTETLSDITNAEQKLKRLNPSS